MVSAPVRVAGSTIMVTGGCGFIGSHLVRQLIASGAARVVVVDSLRYGDRANLGQLSAAVEIVRHTLGTDRTAELDAAMTGVDYLFHLAAEKHQQSAGRELELMRSNIEGTYTLFSLAAQRGVRKIVFTSSLYAYGRMQGPPFVEDEVPQPHTVYGISKLCGEHLLRHIHAAHGVPYNVLRYLFIYGPRQFAGMGYKSVIVKNFERLLAGQPPIVYGDGTQALDYVFVDDAVAATIRALESEHSGEVFNIGSGVPTSVNALIDMMLTVAGSGMPKAYEPADWTAGSCRVGDIRKVRRLLGWKPRTPLFDGLTQTFAWMAQHRRSSTA
jgi:UDP-glucose 4-epimerase